MHVTEITAISRTGKKDGAAESSEGLSGEQVEDDLVEGEMLPHKRSTTAEEEVAAPLADSEWKPM